MPSVEKLERELAELKAALRGGDFYRKHAALHGKGGADPLAVAAGHAHDSPTYHTGSLSWTSVSGLNFRSYLHFDIGETLVVP